MRFLLIALILVVGGCDSGASPETTSSGQTDPGGVVEQWLEAVDAGDVAHLETLVEPVGLAVIAGAENQVRSAEMASLIESGVTGQLARGYWQSFRDDFEAFRNIEIDTITVGEERSVASSSEHVAVEVSTPEQTALVLVRMNEQVGWQVDMVATIGPGFASQLRTYLESALDGEQAEPIADAYQLAVVPGLDAAIALDPNNALLVFETEFIRQIVGG
jgi:hypothetical protein